jgi:WD40 repeat protein
LRETLPLERQPFDLSVSPDQTMVVCMEADGECRVFDLDTGRQVSSRRFESIRARPVAFHADSRRVLIDWQPGHPATFWDVRRDVVETAPAEEILQVDSPAISRPARVIAISTPDRSPSITSLYSIPDGAAFELPGMRRTSPEQMAFSPDGLRVAAGAPDNRIDLYDLTTHQRLGSFIGHTQEVLSIAFSPDGSRLFSSDYDGVIWVWNVATFDDLVQLRGHEAHVRRILVTPDGESLISASGDATVRIWSAPRLQPTEKPR